MNGLASLLLVESLQILVAVGGLIVPGSILAHPYSIEASEPITVIYQFSGGQLFALATFVLLSLGFLAMLRVASQITSRNPTAVAFAAAIPLVAVFVLAYPSGSTDLFQNMADARTVWKYHQMPFDTPPAVHANDPIARAVPGERQFMTSRYGILSYVGAGIPSGVGGDNLLLNIVAFKTYNGLLLLLLAAAVGWGARSLNPGRELVAMAMVAWNPLLLYEAVGNAHNDVLMSVFAVAALVFAWQRKVLASLAALVVGASVKYVTVLLVPFTWAWLWLTGDQRERKLLALVGTIGVLTAMVGYTLFSERILGGAGPAAGQGVVGSPVSVLFYALEPWLGLAGIAPARTICFIAFGILVLRLLAGMKRSPASLWSVSVWTLFGLTFLTATQVYPWYLMWAVPMAAMGPGTRESDVALLSSIMGLVSYAFWPWQPVETVNGELHPNTLYNFVFVLGFFVLPAAYLFLAGRLHLPTTTTLFGFSEGAEPKRAIRQ